MGHKISKQQNQQVTFDEMQISCEEVFNKKKNKQNKNTRTQNSLNRNYIFFRNKTQLYGVYFLYSNTDTFLCVSLHVFVYVMRVDV